jgi:tetratricopeptide (TPR) repeat protein
MNCEGQENLRRVIAQLATPLGIEFNEPERVDLDKQCERVLMRLRELADKAEPPRCLLVFDNVDKAKLLEPAQAKCLPSAAWLQAIVTTRLGEAELCASDGSFAFLPVDSLPEVDAVDLIESRQPGRTFRRDDESRSALEIVRLLGGFTLAVETVAVFLGDFAQDVTCAAFLTRLRKEGLQGLELASNQTTRGVLHGEKGLRATLMPTLARLSTAERAALDYAALLPSDHVVLPWLRTLVTQTHPEMGRDAPPGYPDPWNLVVRRLIGLRLLQMKGVAGPNGHSLVARMHRLVGECVRDDQGDEISLRQNQMTEFLSMRCFELAATWPENQWQIAPLVAFAWNLLDRHDIRAPMFVRALCQWLGLADYGRDSEPLLRAALAQIEAVPTDDPWDLPITLANLGASLYSLGRYGEAESYLRRAVHVEEQARPRNKASMAIAHHHLAASLCAQGRLVEAEAVARRSVTLSESALGRDDPRTLACVSNLAGLLQSIGDLDAAETMYRRVLEGIERAFGPDHRDTLMALNNLSGVLVAQQKPAEAEPLCRRALAGYERVLGPEHLTTLVSANTLVAVLWGVNDVEAETLIRRVVEGRERGLGRDHPLTLESTNDLARFLADRGDYGEAEPLYQRALEGLERVLGPEHPNTLTALHNLAGLLAARGDRHVAEQLYRRALSAREHVLGPEHPVTLTSMYFLWELVKEKGNADEAGSLYGRLVAGRRSLSRERTDKTETLATKLGRWLRR